MSFREIGIAIKIKIIAWAIVNATSITLKLVEVGNIISRHWTQQHPHNRYARFKHTVHTQVYNDAEDQSP